MCDSQGWLDLHLLGAGNVTLQVSHIAALVPGREVPRGGEESVPCTHVWMGSGHRFTVQESVDAIWSGD